VLLRILGTTIRLNLLTLAFCAAGVAVFLHTNFRNEERKTRSSGDATAVVLRGPGWPISAYNNVATGHGFPQEDDLLFRQFEKDNIHALYSVRILNGVILILGCTLAGFLLSFFILRFWAHGNL
jgi:hypothetical protein